MTSYARKIDENLTMSFRVNNKQLLRNYNKIQEKVEQLMRIDDVYGDDDKYIRTKIKIYACSMITNVLNKKMPKEKALCKCLSVIMLHSAIRVNKKYYPQTLLEECQYA